MSESGHFQMSSPSDTPGSQPSATKPEVIPTPGQDDLQALLEAHGLEYTPDGEHVRWQASNPKHPRNWGMLRKIYDSGLIILLDLFTYEMCDSYSHLFCLLTGICLHKERP